MKGKVKFWNRDWSEDPVKLRTTHTPHVVSDTSGASVLNLGSGDEYYSTLPEDSKFYVGSDCSSVALKGALQLYPKGNFVQADAARLPFPDNIFDIVTAVQMLHLTPDDLPAILREARRVTKKSVDFDLPHTDIASIENKPISKLPYGTKFRSGPVELLTSTEQEMESLLKKVGLRPKKIEVFNLQDWEFMGAPIYERMTIPHGKVKATIVIHAAKTTVK